MLGSKKTRRRQRVNIATIQDNISFAASRTVFVTWCLHDVLD